MKKLLGWAVVGMCMWIMIYLGGAALGVNPNIAVVATLIAVVATVAAPEREILLACALIVAVPIAFYIGSLGNTQGVVFAVFLALIFALVAWFSGLCFWGVFTAYLIEVAGIYGTLVLGMWWPAAIAALILGVGWLAIRSFEKMNPAVSI